VPLGDIPDGDAREFRFGRRGGFSMFVVRNDTKIYAYVNVCPHFGAPLNDRAATFLTADSARIRCTKHFSEYRLEDGFGIAGHGVGCWLDRVPVVVEDGVVTIR